MRMIFNDEDPTCGGSLPTCIICEETIQDEDCYCIAESASDEFDLCICEKCKEELINELRHKHINEDVVDFIDDQLTETWRRTPRRW